MLKLMEHYIAILDDSIGENSRRMPVLTEKTSAFA
jgi:hypothetical protein